MQGVVGSNPTVPTNYTESTNYSSNGAFLVFMALCMGHNQREFHMISVTLPDGSQRQFEHPVSIYDVAFDIGAGLARAALAGKVNGELVDTHYLIKQDADIAIITERDEEGLDIIRHSTSHLMAQAVKQIFPEAQVTIGPVIDDGFYYDFSYKPGFTSEDLIKIEKRMADLIKQDLPVVREEVSREAGIEKFRAMGENYKARF
jgi:threonyl-tRNA synthetase